MAVDTTKEIAHVEDQVSKMDQAIAELPAEIATQEEYDRTYEVGKSVHSLYKIIDKKEKSITKPINDSLKQIRDLFRPHKTRVKNVEDDLKDRREVFIKKQDEEAAKKESQIEGRLERGTMKEETAVGKLAEIEETKAETRGGMTSVLVVKVTNIRELPEEYLEVNESAIKAAYREGKEIPGVECSYEKRARA